MEADEDMMFQSDEGDADIVDECIGHRGEQRDREDDAESQRDDNNDEGGATDEEGADGYRDGCYDHRCDG